MDPALYIPFDSKTRFTLPDDVSGFNIHLHGPGKVPVHGIVIDERISLTRKPRLDDMGIVGSSHGLQIPNVLVLHLPGLFIQVCRVTPSPDDIP